MQGGRSSCLDFLRGFRLGISRLFRWIACRSGPTSLDVADPPVPEVPLEPNDASSHQVVRRQQTPPAAVWHYRKRPRMDWRRCLERDVQWRYHESHRLARRLFLDDLTDNLKRDPVELRNTSQLLRILILRYPGLRHILSEHVPRWVGQTEFQELEIAGCVIFLRR